MAAQKNKIEKKPCKIVLNEEQMKLLDFICDNEDKFREQVMADALIQLINPRIGEIGLGHPYFTFYAPLARIEGTKEVMFWIRKPLWDFAKNMKHTHGVALHAITYTATVNYLNMYKDLQKALGR